MKRPDSQLPAVQEPVRTPLSPPVLDAEYESAAAHIPLSHYLWILRRHGWKMLGFVALVVMCTVVVSLRLTPIFESTRQSISTGACRLACWARTPLRRSTTMQTNSWRRK